MIRIDTDQLTEMIHKDSVIQKELEIYLKEDKKKYQANYEKFLKLEKKLEGIHAKQESLEKKREEKQRREETLHSKINHLEVQKIFAERKLKKIARQMAKCKQEEEYQKLLREYSNVQEQIADIDSQQEEIRESISDNSRDIQDILKENKRYHEQEADTNREIAIARENVSEWKLAIETKTNVFYQQKFDTMMTLYAPLRDLLVRNLESDKAMTKEEAKKQTDGVIIEPGEEILVDPPGYVKRLTREKQEEYRNVKKI